MIQSVDRALAILELFKDIDYLGLTEIAKKMGIAKSTAFGLVNTLMSKGFLEKDSVTNKYRLGVILLELGGLYSSRLDIRNEALPFMHGLREKTNETVQLSILCLLYTSFISEQNIPGPGHPVNRRQQGCRRTKRCTCQPGPGVGLLFVRCSDFIGRNFAVITHHHSNSDPGRRL